ncbi:hypothetical protein SERLA73DRAFT_134858, partial [Serpula lacrymans var. lacrymans S7.3]
PGIRKEKENRTHARLEGRLGKSCVRQNQKTRVVLSAVLWNGGMCLIFRGGCLGLDG